MANPLTMYVPISQSAEAQAAAEYLAANFVADSTSSLHSIGTVHYARVSLVPNPAPASGYYAVLVITDFDGTMASYLQQFWTEGNIAEAFLNLMSIALDPPALSSPPTFQEFTNYVEEVNLNPDPATLYNAYQYTVKQIWSEMGA